MAQPDRKFDVSNLTVAERIILVEEIWDSIVVQEESLEITEAQRNVLDRRIESHKDSQESGTSWDELKSELQSEK